ncbi:MAG TPA: dTDP-4-dehydrorhamnose reductase [Candidatus Hydrogenedentes bacterium]|nr:dTDP-4-dehydrorhamnose reductase [Candidatus Hydrogenedentota bacterium]
MATLILGARGQLGRDLCATFARLGDVVGIDLPELDVADRHAVDRQIALCHPAWVINAAAYTDVEKAESDRDAAFRTNETGARVVAEAAAAAGIPVVYYSTDFVFGGDASNARPYECDDPIAPKGVYAASKAAGETATRLANPQHFIVRTAWLYGPGGNNFVEKILRAAHSRPQLKVVDDEVGSPTHTLDLAEATLALCRTEAYGTYHAVNEGSCNRYDFAREILRLAGLTTPIGPCRANEFPSQAPRPAYSVLSNAKLEATTAHRMRPWREALAHYMERRNA